MTLHYITLHYIHTVHTYIHTKIHYITLRYITVHYITYTTYIHTCMHACIHTYIHCIHTLIHTYTNTYIHAYIHAYIHTYMHAYIHAYIHYIHTYIYIYINISSIQSHITTVCIIMCTNKYICIYIFIEIISNSFILFQHLGTPLPMFTFSAAPCRGAMAVPTHLSLLLQGTGPSRPPEGPIWVPRSTAMSSETV